MCNVFSQLSCGTIFTYAFYSRCFSLQGCRIIFHTGKDNVEGHFKSLSRKSDPTQCPFFRTITGAILHQLRLAG